MRKKWDVIVIGHGITGWSTCYHLGRLGYKNVLCLTQSTSDLAFNGPGYMIGGQFDNFSRLAHGFGASFAESLWKFGDRCLDYSHQLLASFNLKVDTGARVRLSASPPEKTEIEKTLLMYNANLPAAVFHGADSHPFGKTGQSINGVFCDGSASASVDTDLLSQSLPDVTTEIGQAVSIVPKHDRIEIVTTESILESEMLVLTCGTSIGGLIPELKEAIIPVGDQYQEATLTGPSQAYSAGTVVTANHGYDWYVFKNDSKVMIGGGRFLRKFAGIGESTPSIDSKVTDYQRKKFAEYFPDLTISSFNSPHALIDGRPCDEMPLIGPMFGLNRTLVSYGYMGNGLATGIYAGKCLAEIIDKGKCSDLPRRLWPERLRNMGEKL